MPHLSLEERNRLLGHLQAGVSPTEVAKMFGTTRQTVYSISSKYLEEGTLKDRPKPGRPRVRNDQTDEQIVTTYRAAPMRQVLSYSAEIGVSARTVVRRLNGVGLYAHRPAIKPKLTANQKVKRLAWAKEHKRWNRAQWANVVFSDEATYVVDSSDRKIRCYRSKGERFNEDMILEKTNRGYGSVNVWGGIIGHQKTPLIRLQGRITADAYIQDVLEAHVLPFFGERPNSTFMQDNAPPHRAILTKDYLAEADIPLLSWPAVSPDLNPIENVWAALRDALKHHPLPLNSDELFALLTRVWDGIDVYPYVSSMRRRILSVIDANGGHIKY